MKISLIVAMASNRVIGRDNSMPWHLSADLQRFKRITLGHPIIMGRLTYEAIGRPLPGRTNIIVSRNLDYRQDGCTVTPSLDSAIEQGCRLADEIFIIGGATLYNAALPIADTLYITEIVRHFVGDTFFPEYDINEWHELEREEISNDSNVDFSYRFLTLTRNNLT